MGALDEDPTCFETLAQVAGTDYGFGCGCQDRRALGASRRCFTSAKQEQRGNLKTLRGLREGLAGNKGSAQARQHALRRIGMAQIQRMAHERSEHGIAEKLKALV